MRPQEREIDREADRDEHQRAERTRCRDPELLARSLRVAVHVGGASEQEQLDALHVDALASCSERVPELVHDQRAEEQQHGDDRRQIRDVVGGVKRVPERP